MKDDQRNSKFKMTNKKNQNGRQQKIQMEDDQKNPNVRQKKFIMEDKRNSKCNNNKD